MMKRTVVALWAGLVFAVGCSAPPESHSALFNGVDTVALRGMLTGKSQGPLQISPAVYYGVGGSVRGVAGFDLFDTLGFWYVAVAVDSLGLQRKLFESAWEEGGCGAGGDDLAGVSLLRLGGRDLLVVRRRTFGEGCNEDLHSEEETLHVLDLQQNYKELLTLPGTLIHVGASRNEGEPRRWDDGLGARYVTYSTDVCCGELTVKTYGTPDAAHATWVGYNWNADSTALVVGRRSAGLVVSK